MNDSNEISKQSSSTGTKNSGLSSPYEKCMSMMKNGEWALLETWLRNLSKLDFDIDSIDDVILCVSFFVFVWG